MQAAGAAPVFEFHHCVGRAVAADAAGIEKDQFGGFVEIGNMGVAEKNGIYAALYRLQFREDTEGSAEDTGALHKLLL